MIDPNYPAGCDASDYESWSGCVITVDENDTWNFDESNIRHDHIEAPEHIKEIMHRVRERIEK